MRTHDTKNHTRQCGGKQGFVNAVETASAAVHVDDEGEGREEVYEIDADGAGEGAVGPGVGDVARVVWQAAFDVVVHAEARA